MSYKESKAEKLKNWVLVVLFLTALLLLFLLWNSNNGRAFELSDLINTETETSPELGDLMEPDLILATDGTGGFTSVSGTGLSDVFGALAQLSKGAGLVVSEISATDYISYISDFFSLQYNLNTPLPLAGLADLYSVNGSASLSHVGNVSTLVLSSGITDGIIVKNSDNKYFCINGENNLSVLDDITSKLSSENGKTYKFLNDYINGAACIPVLAEQNVNYVSILYRSEAYKFEESAAELAEAVFGDTFDFVRKIKDSFGNITYMYGYGQKNLTANTDGSFVFEQEKGTSNSTFAKDLETAITFISEKGGWKGLDGTKHSYKICSYSEEGSLRRFEFAQIQGNLQVGGFTAFVIEVENGQVKYAKRHIISALVSVGSEDVQVDIMQLLQKNSSYINAYLSHTESGEPANTLANSNADIKSLSYVAGNASCIDISYYASDTGNSITPCWRISIGGCNFYFGLEDMEPVGVAEK